VKVLETFAANDIANTLTKANTDKIDQLKKRMEDKQQLQHVEFKKKGTKRQYEHEVSVLEKITEAEEQIEGKEYEEAKKSLGEGKKIIKKRIKVLRIADREDWSIVNKYLSDELASDTDDEKRLAKAIKASNIDREKRNKLRLRRKPYTTALERPRVFPNYSNYQVQKATATNTYSKVPKVCWECGRHGHISKDCIFKAPKGATI